MLSHPTQMPASFSCFGRLECESDGSLYRHRQREFAELRLGKTRLNGWLIGSPDTVLYSTPHDLLPNVKQACRQMRYIIIDSVKAFPPSALQGLK